MKVYIVAMAKNENNYISEWCEWYLNYCFDKVIICDNNSIDGERISDVIDNDKVEIRDYIDRDIKQKEIYTNEYNRIYRECDWVLFCDCDEYIVLEEKYRHDIHNFLSDSIFNDCDTIRLNWMLFSGGDNLDVVDCDYSVVSRFTARYTDNTNEEKYGKNFYRTRDIILLKEDDKILAHFSKKSKNVVNALGKECNNGFFTGRIPCYKNAWINHYPTKTIGEYIRQKYFRGGPNANPYRYNNLKYFFRYNTETQEKKDYANSLIKVLCERYAVKKSFL